jgi:hypothetical protein
MWPFSRLVRNVVEEKEGRLKEGMKVMGLSNAVFWSSWAATYLIILIISCIILTLMMGLTMFTYALICISQVEEVRVCSYFLFIVVVY